MSILPSAPLPDEQPRRSAPTSVYRYYDKAGVLLYVGITNRGVKRNAEHNQSKEWWQYVSGQTVDHYDSREEALELEKQLIRKFRPPFNTQHNPDHEDTRAVYLALVAARSGTRMPKTIRCVPFGYEGCGNQPLLRAVAPIGRTFDIAAPPRLSARMDGSRVKFSRVTKTSQQGSFLIIRLLRDDPNLTSADVHVKWDSSRRPWLMTILFVTVDCKQSAA